MKIRCVPLGKKPRRSDGRISSVLRKVDAQEYQEVSYPYGQTGRWSVLSTEEIYHGFGQYFVTNDLGSDYSGHLLSAEQTEQEVTLRLETRLKERFCLIVNGEIILNNKELCAEQQSQAAPAEVSVRLRSGENRIALVVLRIARMAEVGWRLRMVRAESPVTAYTLLGDVSKEDRADLEESFYRGHAWKRIPTAKANPCTSESANLKPLWWRSSLWTPRAGSARRRKLPVADCG